MTTSVIDLIVGAVFAGINTASTFAKKGIPFQVFEQSGVVDGVWTRDISFCRLANASSTVRTDAAGYSPAG